MGLIQWKKEYTVGIKKLDNQHKEIIKILNQIFKLQEKGKDEKEIERILGNLQDYIKEHFRTEEEYMLSILVMKSRRKSITSLLTAYVSFRKNT